MLNKKIGKYTIIEGAESYISFHSKEKGIIFFHGFSGTPAEMIPFAKMFEKKGISVYCPRTPGHGTNENDFITTDHKMWLQFAYDSYLEFKSQIKKVDIVGLSMGGILASYASLFSNNSKLALLATPYDLPDKKMKYAKFLSYFKSKIPIPDNTIPCNSPEGRKFVIAYRDYYYLKPISELYYMIRTFHSFIKKIKSDTLIIQSEKDKIVTFRSPQKIYNKIKSYNKKLVYLKKSGHVLTVDLEQNELFKLIYNFFYKF